MTHSERIAQLETKLAEAERITSMFTRGLSDDGLVPYLMLNGRLGICTAYWSQKPLGQGATFSVGTAIDRFAGYFEIDEAVCPDHPSVAVFASVTCPNGQPNHAFEGAVANGAENRGLCLSFGDKLLLLRTEGIQLIGDWLSFHIGKTLADAKRLWP